MWAVWQPQNKQGLTFSIERKETEKTPSFKQISVIMIPKIHSKHNVTPVEMIQKVALLLFTVVKKVLETIVSGETKFSTIYSSTKIFRIPHGLRTKGDPETVS